MGYRLPGAFLALANRLLPIAAPGVAPSRSVRADGDPPDLPRARRRASSSPAVAEHALALAKEFATVAVIAADARVDELRRAIEDRGRRARRAGRGRARPSGRRACPRGSAKGLEFDAVIVVEPAEIAATEPHGVRLLFVALDPRGAAPRARPRPARCPAVLRRLKRQAYAAAMAGPTPIHIIDPQRQGARRSPTPACDARRRRRHGRSSEHDGVLEIRRDPRLEHDRRALPGRHRRHVGTDLGQRRARRARSARCASRPSAARSRVEHAATRRRAHQVGRASRSATCEGDCRVVTTSSKVHVGQAERATIAGVSGVVDARATSTAPR